MKDTKAIKAKMQEEALEIAIRCEACGERRAICTSGLVCMNDCGGVEIWSSVTLEDLDHSTPSYANDVKRTLSKAFPELVSVGRKADQRHPCDIDTKKARKADLATTQDFTKEQE